MRIDRGLGLQKLFSRLGVLLGGVFGARRAGLVPTGRRPSGSAPGSPAQIWAGSAETGRDVIHASGMLHGARETQEDEVGWIEASTLDPEGEHPVAVVADGMGGHAAGDVASQIAVRAFIAAYGGEGPAPVRLGEALDVANRALREAMQENEALAGMGTTLVAAAVTEDGLHWISVGDSPLYLYRDGCLQRLNADHSMRPVIAAIQKEDPDLAAEYNPHALRSVLMGAHIPKIDASKQATPLKGGDIVLAATDGLDTIDDEETLQVFKDHRGEGPEAICGGLLRAVEAKQHPRQDNTTVALLELQRPEENGLAPTSDEEEGVPEPTKTEDLPAAAAEPHTGDIQGESETAEVEAQPGGGVSTTLARSVGTMGQTRVRLRSAAIATAFAVLGAPQVAPGQPDFGEVPEQVFIVRGFDSMGRAVGDISGFAVGAGIVVTNAQMLRAAESVVVVTPDGAEEFPATVTASDRRSDVAILQAEGLAAAGARFAADGAEPETGDGFYLPRFAEDGSLDDEPTRGSVSELRILEPVAVGDRAVLLYRHNAQAEVRQYGMPMLNDCGEVIGLLRTDPGMSQTVLNTRPDPGESPFGVSAAEVRRVLAMAEVEPRIATDPCLDPYQALEQAQGEAESARQAEEDARREAEAAEDRLREMDADSESTQEELGVARQEADAARAEADRRKNDLDAAEGNLDAARQRVDMLEAENRRLLTALILGGGAALALVLALWYRLHRRREDLAASEEALKSAIRPAAFSCLLEGADDAGRTYVVKISAEQLGSPSGVVVGRNPAQAGALLDHPEASREHFRLAVRGDGLVIMDLHSTNGTLMDGERLQPGEAAPVPNRGVIGVGSAISLTLSVSRVST